ncbi:MAG TPA: serine--tRNA ligase, partial [Candidatus Jacksonbacteria bacterium]|nr:serine--tRNA ligase [Candidatus Jacksonbacteria bacterium]
MGGKPSMAEIERLREVKAKITNYELRITNTENELNILLVQLPNITHESVPVGKDDTENVVYKKWSSSDPEKGSIKKPKFSIKPHYEIGKALDLIDEEKGAKVAGSRFWYLKNELVYLEFALLHYALEFLKKEGFTPVIPPMIVRERALYGTGFFPADEHEIYRLANPEFTVEGENIISNVIPSWNDPKQFLIGTAEVPLAAYHADDTLDLSKPLKYCGFSSCFRREAGTYGKDMKGILRGHQFDKIEMFIFAS